MDFGQFIINEWLGGFKYAIPRNKITALMDFYAVNSLFHSEPKTFGDADKKDQLNQLVEEIKNNITVYLKNILLQDVKDSIYKEIQHVFDYSDMNLVEKVPKDIKDFINFLNLSRDLADRLEIFIDYERRFGVEKTISAIKNVFSYLKWGVYYGGKKWAYICEAWLLLYKSKTISEQIIAIDHLVDLQHNTGNVLNKISDWENLNVFLNLKNDPIEKLLTECSPSMQYLFKLYQRIFKKQVVDIKNVSLEGFRNQIKKMIEEDDFHAFKSLIDRQRRGRVFTSSVGHDDELQYVVSLCMRLNRTSMIKYLFENFRKYIDDDSVLMSLKRHLNFYNRGVEVVKYLLENYYKDKLKEIIEYTVKEGLDASFNFYFDYYVDKDVSELENLLDISVSHIRPSMSIKIFEALEKKSSLSDDKMNSFFRKAAMRNDLEFLKIIYSKNKPPKEFVKRILEDIAIKSYNSRVFDYLLGLEEYDFGADKEFLFLLYRLCIRNFTDRNLDVLVSLLKNIKKNHKESLGLAFDFVLDNINKITRSKIDILNWFKQYTDVDFTKAFYLLVVNRFWDKAISNLLFAQYMTILVKTKQDEEQLKKAFQMFRDNYKTTKDFDAEVASEINDALGTGIIKNLQEYARSTFNRKKVSIINKNVGIDNFLKEIEMLKEQIRLLKKLIAKKKKKPTKDAKID